MHLKHSFTFAVSAFVAAAAVSGTSYARRPFSAQICTLASAGAGTPGTLICKSVQSGAVTQSIPLGATASDAGGIGGSLTSYGDQVLVTNLVDGAILFHVKDGYLTAPVVLRTNGEKTLSGALNHRGAYVLTGTTLRFFPSGQTAATTSQRLLLGDGSAAQVTLTNRYAYVSEKNGSLEAFALGHEGDLRGQATTVTGIDPGVIVGITGHDDLVVAPIAHLASNFAQAEISVVAGVSQAAVVPTKEVAACWTAHEEEEACVSNPGSMTISCGKLGSTGFETYTSAAASPAGESMFDIDMQNGLVGIQAVHAGAPVLLVYERGRGDFLSLVTEMPVGTAKAAGALLLPPAGR
jgi:hypothetical protein